MKYAPYLCECNSKTLSHELFQSSIAMTSMSQKSICVYKDWKVWDRVCCNENQFFTINSCEWLSTSFLKSFTWFLQVLDELLSIHSFIPSTCPAHDFTNFIDFDSSFAHFLI